MKSSTQHRFSDHHYPVYERAQLAWLTANASTGWFAVSRLKRAAFFN